MASIEDQHDEAPETTDAAITAAVDQIMASTGERPGRERVRKHLPAHLSPGSGRIDRVLRTYPKHADRGSEQTQILSPVGSDRSGLGQPVGSDRSAVGTSVGSDRSAGESPSATADRSGLGQPVGPERSGLGSPRRSGARLVTTLASVGEQWADRMRPTEAPTARDEAPTAPTGRAHQWAIRAAVGLGLLGTGVVTWTGAVSLATRLGWSSVPVAPGLLGWEINPAMFLPLSVELVLAVAVHRVATTRGPARAASVALAGVAFAIALLVQRYAHATALPGWLGPVVGVVPVVSLAMLVALSTIHPNRGR